jgi:hypothetical protein
MGMKDPKLNLSAPWPDVKEKIKEANVELTDSDLEYIPGKEEVLLQHLSKKMNWSTEEVRNWIESVAVNKGKAS